MSRKVFILHPGTHGGSAPGYVVALRNIILRLEAKHMWSMSGAKRRTAWSRNLPALSMLLTVLVASAGPTAPDAWLIVPGVRAGPVTITTSEQDLVELFGRENVVSSDIPIGEGLTVPGTLLFPQDPTRKLVVIWKDPDRHSVKEARVTEDGTLWSTDTGITIGTSLKEIERINQRPFRLAGFDWDYGGTVLDWSGGALAELDRGTESGSSGRKLILRLAPRDVPQNQPDYRKVKGSREFSSGHPSMQALNPVVYELIVFFDEN